MDIPTYMLSNKEATYIAMQVNSTPLMLKQLAMYMQ